MLLWIKVSDESIKNKYMWINNKYGQEQYKVSSKHSQPATVGPLFWIPLALDSQSQVYSVLPPFFPSFCMCKDSIWHVTLPTCSFISYLFIYLFIWLRMRAFMTWACARLQMECLWGHGVTSSPWSPRCLTFFIFSPTCFDRIKITVICRGILLHLWLNCGVSTQCGCLCGLKRNRKAQSICKVSTRKHLKLNHFMVTLYFHDATIHVL